MRAHIYEDDGDRTAFLAVLARSVVLNPVRARMVHNADNWPWSSYQATAGGSAAPAWLTTEWILAAFACRTSDAHQAYRRFVREGLGQSNHQSSGSRPQKDTRQDLTLVLDVDSSKHFIRDGHVYTSAGISAGIDMSLMVVADYFGDNIARATAKHMEYPYPESAERRIEI